MRTITKKIKLYNHADLISGDHDEVKQRVLQELHDINVDYKWWDGDCWLGLTQEEHTKRRIPVDPYTQPLFKFKEISGFDLDRGNYIQFSEVEVTNEDHFRKFLRVPVALWGKCNWDFDYSYGRFNSPTLDIYKDWAYSDATPRQQKILDRAMDIWAGKVAEALTFLRNDYEYRLSEEAIMETIQVNGYEFTEDGEIYG